MKIAIYARVSDAKLKEDGTRRQDINRQIDLLTEYCKRKGYENIEIYADDGKSAWTDDLNARPAFAKLRREVLLGHVKRIVVESMDRLASNLATGLDWLAEFSKANCVVESLQSGEHEVTTDEGWMKSSMFLMLSVSEICGAK